MVEISGEKYKISRDRCEAIPEEAVGSGPMEYAMGRRRIILAAGFFT